MELDTTGFLNQEAEPSGTTVVDACNGFKKLGRLAMLCTMRHHCPAGGRFELNSYKHWVQLLLLQSGEPPVTLLIREGLTQVDPLLMVLYGVTLAPLAEELRAADPWLLSPFYAGDSAFGRS